MTGKERFSAPGSRSNLILRFSAGVHRCGKTQLARHGSRFTGHGSRVTSHKSQVPSHKSQPTTRALFTHRITNSQFLFSAPATLRYAPKLKKRSLKGIMNRAGKIIFWIVLILAGAAGIGWSYHVRNLAEGQITNEVSLARVEADRIQREVVRFTEGIVPARVPFHLALQGMGVDPLLAEKIASAAQSTFDLRHFRAGNKLSIGRGILGDLRSVRYRIDTDRELIIARQVPPAPQAPPPPDEADFHSAISTIPSETETAGVSGTVQGSLFESVIDAGEKPELAMRLAEIFGWDVDFYTDPRPGDTFRIVVEKKKFSNGETGLRPHSRRGIQQRWEALSRRAIP